MNVRRWFVISALLHLGVGLGVGLWVCPWFERMTPNTRVSNDLDFDVLPYLSDKASASGSKGSRAPVKEKAENVVSKTLSKTLSKTPAPVESKTAAASQASQSNDVFVDTGDGQAKSFTSLDYMRWVKAHNEQPIYPRLAQLRDEQGRVIVRVEVDGSGGSAEVIRIETSSGHELLDHTALQAVQGWKFPAFRGQVTRLTLLFPFRFEFTK
jgi:TonB family protein